VLPCARCRERSPGAGRGETSSGPVRASVRDGPPMTIRGGGNPTRNMALEPRFRVGPPPRSPAADAHGCIMVRPHRGPTGYKVVARRLAPRGRLPSDRRLRSSTGCKLPSWEVPRSYHLSVLPDAPEWRDRGKELQQALDAAQATLEERGQAAGELSRPSFGRFFSAGRGWTAASHIPVETAQYRASAMARRSRAKRSGWRI
jgi:hypothetical protein